MATGTSKTAPAKKTKIREVVEFSPPEIILQNPQNITPTNTGYRCVSKKHSCSVNFSLSGAIAGYEYEWDMDGEVTSTKNPRAHTF